LKKRRKSSNNNKKNLVATAQRKIVKTILLFVFSFLVVIFLIGDHGVYQLYRLKMLRNNTQKRIEELRENKQVLADEKHRLKTDLNYIESIAREKYRMAKSGEKVFKVIPRDND